MSSEVQPATPTWVVLTAAFVRRMPAGRYRAMNRICRWKTPPAFLARMPRELGGGKFVCDLRDSISREVCYTGRYEIQETAILRSILRPGMTFFDVGANWGYFTLVAAHQVGLTGRVVSFEPDPRIFDRLRECVTRNELSQVTPLQIAAAGQAATLSLCGYDDNSDNFGLSRIAENVAGNQTFAVAARPLDDVIHELGVEQIDLLKMDIEGYEGYAITGMKASLGAHLIRRIILELHPNQMAEHGHSAADLVEELRGFGYRPYRIDHSPAAFRRASYSKEPNPQDFLMPLPSGTALDDWPHLVFTAPGFEI